MVGVRFRTGLAALVLLPPVLALLPVPAPARDDAREVEDRRALADGLYHRGMYALAVAEYAALLRDSPDIPGQDLILYRMGEGLRHEGRLDQAERAFRQVVRRFPDGRYAAPAAFKRACLFLDLEQYESAAELFEQLLRSDPPPGPELRESALYVLADSLHRIGRPAKALPWLDTLLEEFPRGEYADYANLLRARILSQGDDGEKRRSRQLFADLAEASENPRIVAEALFRRADLLARDGDAREKAATVYLRLLRDFPDDERSREARLPAARVFLQTGRFNDALNLATTMAGRDDLADQELAQWLYLRANSEVQLMRLAEALETYRRLLEMPLPPEMLETVLFEKSLALHRRGDAARVLEVAGRINSQDPRRDQELLWIQARAAEDLSESGAAIQFYRLLVTRHPEAPLSAEALYALGRYLWRQENWLEASLYFTRLADRFPDHSLVAPSLLASGMAQSRAGRSEDALRQWRRLLGDFPDHETVDEALYQKAVEEKNRNKPELAMKAVERLLEKTPRSERRPDALYLKAVMLYEERDLSSSAGQLRLALDAGPDPTLKNEILFLLGICLHGMEREAEAAEVLQPLLDKPVRENFAPDRLAWLAEFQYSRGNFVEAGKAARALSRQAPDAYWAEAGATLLGRALLKTGDTAAAAESLAAALDAGAGSRYLAEAALLLGRHKLESGEVEAAESFLRRAAAAARGDESIDLRAAAYASLASAAEKQGDLLEAVRYNLGIGLLFDDDKLSPEALAGAARHLLALGREDDARATARELIQRYPETEAAAYWAARLAEDEPTAGE